MSENLTPVKQSDVFAKLETLDRALSDLEKVAHNLENKLEVVMQSDYPQENKELTESENPRCELSARILGLIDNVRHQTQFIDKLSRRLEI